jgi:hypothetical protein
LRVDWDLLDNDARIVVWEARREAQRRRRHPGPHDLLLALAAEKHTLRLFAESGVRVEDVRALPAFQDPPDEDALARLVTAAAGIRGEQRLIAPEHLLQVLLQPDVWTSEPLQDLGLTEEGVRRLAKARPTSARGEPPPGEVMLVGAFLGLHGLCCSVTMPWGMSSGLMVFLQAIWNGLFPLVAAIALGLGRPSTWAPAQAYLGARTVALLAATVGAAVASDSMGSTFAAGVMMLVYLGPAGLLLRTREWFGVERRQLWSTLWKRGWWSLVITAGLDLTTLTMLFSSAHLNR